MNRKLEDEKSKEMNKLGLNPKEQQAFKKGAFAYFLASNYYLLIVIALIVLTACQQNLSLDTTAEKIKHRNISTCLIDDLEANPAAYHRSGSSNGMAFEDGPINSDYLSDASSLAKTIEASFPSVNFGRNMVLIVADDFGAAHNSSGKSVYKLDPSLYELSFSDFGDVTDTVSAYKAMNDHFQTMLAKGLISHGAQVLTLTLDVFEELGATLITMKERQIVVKLNGATIVIQAVEVGGMASAEIKNAIEDTVTDYQAQGFENMVVNMSWTLEPCKSVERFRRSKAASFDEFLTSNPPSVGTGDPLYDYIHAANNRQVLFVAAAGNYGDTHPRQPAKMPRVISTSAQFANTTGLKAPFSNSAEVMLEGAYLRLRDPYNRNGVGAEANAALLVGTSYSAPASSIASLIDSGSLTTRCGFAGVTPRLAHGVFSNPTLDNAVLAHCLP